MTRRVGFIVYPGFQLLGLSGPVCAFQLAREEGTRRAYEIDVVSVLGGEVACSAGFKVATTKASSMALDTLIVVGGNAIWEDPTMDEVASMILALGNGTRRIASICTGAFALARVGLLDGRKGTTHWRHLSRLRDEFPQIQLVTDRIFTHDGDIWTSAGISAGLDLALAMIEEDLGTASMRVLAQELVVRQREVGGQPQFFSTLELEATSDRVRRALTYAQGHLEQTLTVDLADIACLSGRQLSRAFLRETGLTVAKAVERIRVDAARYKIEATFEPIEAISMSCGFGDPERMRRAFVRLFGQPPQALRRVHRARAI